MNVLLLPSYMSATVIHSIRHTSYISHYWKNYKRKIRNDSLKMLALNSFLLTKDFTSFIFFNAIVNSSEPGI